MLVGVRVALGVAEGLLVTVGTEVFEAAGVDVVAEVGAMAAEAAPAVDVAVGDAEGVTPAGAAAAVEGLPWQLVVPESVNVFPASGVNFQL